MTRRALLLCLTAALAILVSAQPATAFFGGGGGGMKEGDVAPDFNAQTIDGQTLNYSQMRGKKVVVLDFWSIYCASCIEEMPRLIEIYNEFKDKGLVMVGVNLDSFGTQRVVRFMQGMPNKINFPVIIDKDRKVATAFSAMVLPTTLVIGADGKVRFYHVGYKPGDEKHLRTVIADAVKQIKK